MISQQLIFKESSAALLRRCTQLQLLRGTGTVPCSSSSSTRFFSTSPSSTTPALFEKIPEKVRIVEVGARDGLQNEKKFIPTETKLELIQKLADCGLKSIEATSFVSAKWVPQMGDHAEITKYLSSKTDSVHYPVLVPNMKGLEGAIECGAKEIAVFATPSESFCKKNANCTVAESIEKFKSVTGAALKEGIAVRGYVSCVIGCPYEGPTSPDRVAEVSEQLYEAGCYEISLGDTIGTGTAHTTERMLSAVLGQTDIPIEKVAMHFHDTYGQALTNLLVGLQMGVSVVDASVGGLGGCPYAKGATGNVATEEVVYLLDSLGVQHGVDLMQLVRVGNWISTEVGRETQSKVGRALTAKHSL